MSLAVSTVFHLFIILLLIALFAFTIYYIRQYNTANYNLQNCNIALGGCESLVATYRKLPVPLTALRTNNLINSNVGILLTYDPKGTQILAPIPNGSITNVGLVNRTGTSADPVWYVTKNPDGNYVILDSTKTRYIAAPNVVTDAPLVLETITTNNEFILSTGLLSSLSTNANPQYTVYASSDNPSILKLIRTENLSEDDPDDVVELTKSCHKKKRLVLLPTTIYALNYL